jgi:predicted house-cleaning NTP pyrophosphatase (Maf/HAM1 superfamily)
VKTLLFLLPVLALLPACLSLNSEEQQAEAAEKAVLAKHDELMIQMDQLTTLRQQLQKSPGPDTAAAARQRRALLAADAAMMDWMHQYRKPADTVAAARRLGYFAGQQRKIDSVAGLFHSSVDSARLLLRAASPPTSAPFRGPGRRSRPIGS